MDLEKSIEDSIWKFKSSNISSSSNCENLKYLQCKIDYLEKTLAKFTSGRANLDALLTSQNCFMGKTGLGYDLERKQKAYKNFFNFSTPSTSSFISCHYCIYKGHSSSSCFIKRHGVRSEKYNGFPKKKKTANPMGTSIFSLNLLCRYVLKPNNQCGI